jgi:antitoxin CptB
MNDVNATQKARLKWNSRRGMLELDLILGRFVEKKLDSLNSTQLEEYEHLLTQHDPDLYAWLMGYETPNDAKCVAIINLIRLQDHI